MSTNTSIFSKVPSWAIFFLWLIPIFIQYGIDVLPYPRIILLSFIENCSLFALFFIINLVVLYFVKNKSEFYIKKTAIFWGGVCICSSLLLHQWLSALTD